ncbi:MAG: alpha,4-glucan--maltose-phosphate maltosyltransferase [Acidimicrobiales bacterium]|nr:alpha,4-glucan--maltose-phosphate maltosyltransferase [Acidimicrobiales bacterium]
MIDDVRPRTPEGFPAKAAVGHPVSVSATVFRDGHDLLGARVRWRAVAADDGKWQSAPLMLTNAGVDHWTGTFEPVALGVHEFVVEAWSDRYATWRHDVTVKRAAGQDVDVELEEGARLIERMANELPAADRGPLIAAAAALRDADAPLGQRMEAGFDDEVAALLAGVPDPIDLTGSELLPLWVDRERALVSAWYELFPRSHGGFAGAAGRLAAVAEMGFDVVYLPPIHPIGTTARKGRNNTLTPAPEDPGSPWAIGAAGGGHTAVDPGLGSVDDFDAFVAGAQQLGLEVALDYALQCSPDHPWVKEHPEWFHHRPDGSIKYAENPPKKYQDIYPINFWPPTEDDRRALWRACKEILDHWIAHGVRIFRVDNPHTKPMVFWAWLLESVQREHPEVLFLAEAFTRPPVMAKLAEVGFSQSYTYFTWRTTKADIVEYVEEISHAPAADYMRPNFWPNTPDILSGPLRDGPPAAFRLRLLLAALTVPSYGIYSGFELCENVPMSDTNEEYFESEKYEIKDRDFDRPDSLAPFITQVNAIRRQHPAFCELGNIVFHHTGNDALLVWSRRSPDGSDTALVVANLDPWHAQEDVLGLDLGALGIPADASFEVRDELTGAAFVWQGPSPYVRLDPAVEPGHVFAVRVL